MIISTNSKLLILSFFIGSAIAASAPSGSDFSSLTYIAFGAALVAIVFSFVACFTHIKASQSKRRNTTSELTSLARPYAGDGGATEMAGGMSMYSSIVGQTTSTVTSTTMIGGATLMNTHMPLAIPAYMEMHLENFSINKKIAEGGAGSVYLATPLEITGISSMVVLKIMKATLEASPEMKDLFYQEVAITQSFSGHRNFVMMHGFIANPRGMVMKLYQHGTLEDLVMKKSNIVLSYNLCVLFSCDMATALSEMHQRQITHNDIKPDNVLIDKDEHGYVAVLCDYSISSVNGKELKGVKKFRTVDVEGHTLQYAAPEILRRHESTDISGDFPHEAAAKADIFSMAMTIYAMVIQGKPWVNVVSGAKQLKEALYNGVRPPFPNLSMMYPDNAQSILRLKSLIELAWSQDPSARPEAKQLLEKMKKL